MSKHTWRTAAIAIVLVFIVLYPAFQPALIGASQPEPLSPSPPASPNEPEGEQRQSLDAPGGPPAPDQLPASVERARARQAVQEVLAKYLDYWGPRYRVALPQVAVEGGWAHATIAWQSEARPLEGPIHVLARRSPQGDWQALMPGSDGLYLPWVDAVPESLVPARTKDELRDQAARVGALHARTLASVGGARVGGATETALPAFLGPVAPGPVAPGPVEPDPGGPGSIERRPTPAPRTPQPETWVAGATSVSGLGEEERAWLCGVPEEELEWERSQQRDPEDLPARTYDYPSALDWRSVKGQDWRTAIRKQ